MRHVVWSAVFLGTACSSDNAVYERDGYDTFFQVPTDQVDILWVVDDSHSMKEEQQLLSVGFQSFIDEIEYTDSDFHIGVITTSFDYSDSSRGKLVGEPTVITKDDDYVSLFQERVKVGIYGSDREKGMEAANYALSALMATGANSGFLRSEAYLLVVFVSDENDCSDEGALESMEVGACYDNVDMLVPVSEYVSDFRALKADPNMVQLGAIVGPAADQGCQAVPGRRYWELVSSMGGLQGDICAADWNSILYTLGLNASGVNTSFTLSDAAKLETIQVWVDAVEVEQGETSGWSYNAENWVVSFHGDAVPARGSQVDIAYTIQSGG